MGKISVIDNKARIEFERFLPHPPESVWNALTNNERLRSWYLSRTTIEPGMNGKIEFWFGREQTHVTGKITIWSPPFILEHEWNIEPSASLPKGEKSIVRWELTQKKDGTLVRLLHINLTELTAKGGNAPNLDPAPAHHLILDRLEAYLDSKPLPDAAVFMQSLVSEYRKLR